MTSGPAPSATPPSPPPPGASAAAPLPTPLTPGLIAEARALVARFECRRCHEGLPGQTVVRERACVGCHQDIAAGRFPADSATLARWRRDIVHLRFAPRLRPGGRLRRAWLASWLLRPHDVRPHLGAQMPRLPLTPRQARVLAMWLGDPESRVDAASPSPAGSTPGDAATGAALFAARGCAACHGAPPAEGLQEHWRSQSSAQALAPDLRHTASRMRPATLVAWLRSPRAVDPHALMPETGLSAREAQDVAAWLRGIAVAPAPPPAAPPPPPPLLNRPVRWTEVAEQVLHRSCWHCHADADFAYGDGGPGNTGGFGYPGRGVRFRAFADVHAGARDRAGQPISLTRGDLLVRSLLARHVEVAGGEVAGVVGMPLGLPPLPLADIALIRTWIAQGAPR